MSIGNDDEVKLDEVKRAVGEYYADVATSLSKREQALTAKNHLWQIAMAALRDKGLQELVTVLDAKYRS